MTAPGVTAVFCVALALDFLWSRFAAAFNRGDRARAIAWNAALDTASTIGIWLVVDDRLMLLPALAGGALGLWLGMGQNKTQAPREEPGLKYPRYRD